MSKNLLIVYVKNPVAGKVKSRLIPSLGKESALLVYQELLLKLGEWLNRVDIPIRISYDTIFLDSSMDLKVPHSKTRQLTGSLGDKMYHDIKMALREGYQKVCLIGSDIPDINEKIISSAMKALDRVDVVLGPTFDGGYYLIGVNQQILPDNKWFEKIPWSTSSVLAETLQRLNEQKVKYELIQKLRDLDTFEDLLCFPEIYQEITLPEA